MKGITISTAFFFTFFLAAASFGGEVEDRLKAMEDTLKAQKQTLEEQNKVINGLRDRAAVPSSVKESKSPKATGLFGASSLTNPNISLILNTFAYKSNLKDDQLSNRGIPGYTTGGITNRNGFNLDSAELFIFAPVDPYFNLYATIPITEDGAEVEEGYFVTTSLPYGFQLKGGKFKSGFGRINSQHPHAWDFTDIPLPYRGFMGGEGIIEKGAQITYLPPLSFYTLVGIELLQGENETLFGDDAKSGIHAASVYAKGSFDIGDSSTILFGPSVITGKTKTDSLSVDSEFSGTSTLYGVEMTYKWKPSKVRSFILQSEYLYRRQTGEMEDTAALTIESLKRSQDGLYFQGTYQINRFRFGARYDALDLIKSGYIKNGDKTSFGKKPWRASGMIEFNPTEFSRIRLQYNHDKSARDEKTNNEIMLQLIFGIGAHGAHSF